METGLQTLNQQQRTALWAERIRACRSSGQTVQIWCRENGVFQWPRNETEVRELTPQQYRWLMEGLKVDRPKAHKAVTGLSVV